MVKLLHRSTHLRAHTTPSSAHRSLSLQSLFAFRKWIYHTAGFSKPCCCSRNPMLKACLSLCQPIYSQYGMTRTDKLTNVIHVDLGYRYVHRRTRDEWTPTRAMHNRAVRLALPKCCGRMPAKGPASAAISTYVRHFATRSRSVVKKLMEQGYPTGYASYSLPEYWLSGEYETMR
jgi:hypothetical protein